MTAPIEKPRIMHAMGVSKSSHGEKKRIEVLGRMSDRHMRYLAEGNRQALLDLADEYESLGHYGMPLTASRIRKEAENVDERNKENTCITS